MHSLIIYILLNVPNIYQSENLSPYGSIVTLINDKREMTEIVRTIPPGFFVFTHSRTNAVSAIEHNLGEELLKLGFISADSLEDSERENITTLKNRNEILSYIKEKKKANWLLTGELLSLQENRKGQTIFYSGKIWYELINFSDSIPFKTVLLCTLQCEDFVKAEKNEELELKMLKSFVSASLTPLKNAAYKKENFTDTNINGFNKFENRKNISLKELQKINFMAFAGTLIPLEAEVLLTVAQNPIGLMASGALALSSEIGLVLSTRSGSLDWIFAMTGGWVGGIIGLSLGKEINNTFIALPVGTFVMGFIGYKMGKKFKIYK
ncbi:MAG: hypothetical protein WC614_12655 [bacterium]